MSPTDIAALAAFALMAALALLRRPAVRAHVWRTPATGVAGVRVDGALCFPDAAAFEDAALAALAGAPKARWLIVDAAGAERIDACGEAALRRVVDHLRAAGVVTVFAGLTPPVRSVMEATGLLAAVGREHVFATAGLALAACHGERPRLRLVA